MASDKKRRFEEKGSYAKYLLQENKQSRSLPPDDDEPKQSGREPSFSSTGTIKEKMAMLRRAADERKNAKESLPVREPEFDGTLKTKTGRRTGVLALGISICIFALIGFITVIYLICAGIGTAVKNNPALKRYDDIIAPIAYFDPDPFETLDGIDNETLIYICLWETVSNNSEQYSISESGKTTVPVADVNATAVKLFGSAASLDYTVFAGNETDIEYIEDTDSLEVFNTGIDGFTHETIKIKSNGKQKEVTVGYVEPDVYGLSEKDGDTSYAKKMIFILQKDDQTGEYYVAALRECDD